MYLHIGGEVMVPLDELVIIIDLEAGSRRDATKEFLSLAADDKKVVDSGKGRKRSILVTKEKIYYSPISVDTLVKRTQV